MYIYIYIYICTPAHRHQNTPVACCTERSFSSAAANRSAIADPARVRICTYMRALQHGGRQRHARAHGGRQRHARAHGSAAAPWRQRQHAALCQRAALSSVPPARNYLPSTFCWGGRPVLALARLRQSWGRGHWRSPLLQLLVLQTHPEHCWPLLLPWGRVRFQSPGPCHSVCRPCLGVESAHTLTNTHRATSTPMRTRHLSLLAVQSVLLPTEPVLLASRTCSNRPQNLFYWPTEPVLLAYRTCSAGLRDIAVSGPYHILSRALAVGNSGMYRICIDMSLICP